MLNKLSKILITSAGEWVALIEIIQRTAKEMGVDTKVYTTDRELGMSPACRLSDGSFVVPRCSS